MVRFKPDEHGTLEYSDLHSDLFEGGRDSEKLYLLVRHLVDFASPKGRLRSPLYLWLWGWSPRSYGIRNIHGVLPEQEVSGRRDVYRISD